LLALLVLGVILVPFFCWGAHIDDWTEELVAWGHHHPWKAALWLGGLLAVDVLAPIPSSLVSTACGSLLGFWAGTLASFAGMTVSAAAGYLLGRCAAGPARRALGSGDFKLMQRLHGRWGVWMLAALRPVPVLAEASLLFAGLAAMPWRGALPVLLCGNLAVSAVYGAIGTLATEQDATWLAFVAAALLSGLAIWLFKPLRSPPPKR